MALRRSAVFDECLLSPALFRGASVLSPEAITTAHARAFKSPADSLIPVMQHVTRNQSSSQIFLYEKLT